MAPYEDIWRRPVSKVLTPEPGPLTLLPLYERRTRRELSDAKIACTVRVETKAAFLLRSVVASREGMGDGLMSRNGGLGEQRVNNGACWAWARIQSNPPPPRLVDIPSSGSMPKRSIELFKCTRPCALLSLLVLLIPSASGQIVFVGNSKARVADIGLSRLARLLAVPSARVLAGCVCEIDDRRSPSP